MPIGIGRTRMGGLKVRLDGLIDRAKLAIRYVSGDHRNHIAKHVSSGELRKASHGLRKF